MVEQVLISEIEIAPGRREVDEGKIKAIASSIEDIGLQTPISLWLEEEGDGQRAHLVTGLHRLKAAQSLGWQEIDCTFVDLSEEDRIIWEVDENLMRSNLSPAQEAHELARRKEAWERKRSNVSEQVVPKPQGGRPEGFAAETAKVTGKTKQDINRSISRAVIPPDVMSLVHGTKLDTGSYLDKLKKLHPDHAAMKERIQADLDRLARTERSEALQAEAAERRKEAKEAEKRARHAACDLLLDSLSPRDWDRLIGLVEQAGGSLKAKDLRDWQAPSAEEAA